MLHSSVKVHGNLWTRLRGAGDTRLWRRGGSSRSERAPAARALPGMRPRLGPQHVGDRGWRLWEGVAPLGGLQSCGGQPPGRLRAQRTEMAAGSVTWLVGLASAGLSEAIIVIETLKEGGPGGGGEGGANGGAGGGEGGVGGGEGGDGRCGGAGGAPGKGGGESFVCVFVCCELADTYDPGT